MQNTVQASSRASPEHLQLLALSRISCSHSALMQCRVLKTSLHGSDLTSACHLGNPGQIEQNPAAQRKLPNHINPPQGASGHSQGPCNATGTSAVPGMNRSISGCLQESEEMPGQDDVRAVENIEEQKSFCLKSNCEFKIQNTYLSISTALQTAIHANPSRGANQNYFNNLSLVS